MNDNEKKRVFATLNEVNVNEHTEKKDGLTYLSWAWAWQEVSKRFPDATYEIVKQPNGLPYLYDPQTGYMCYTRVTIGGDTKEMWLPVMDAKNKAMKAERYEYFAWNKNTRQYDKKFCEPATMFDINKTIMRCLTKNLAMFGLGLYIYAGEDLPDVVDESEVAAAEPAKPQPQSQSEEEQKHERDFQQRVKIIGTAQTTKDILKIKDDFERFDIRLHSVMYDKMVEFVDSCNVVKELTEIKEDCKAFDDKLKDVMNNRYNVIITKQVS